MFPAFLITMGFGLYATWRGSRLSRETMVVVSGILILTGLAIMLSGIAGIDE